MKKKSMVGRIAHFMTDMARNLSKRGATKWMEDCKTLFSAAVDGALDGNRHDFVLSPETTGRALYAFDWKLVPSALPGLSFSSNAREKYDYCFLWGLGKKNEQCAVLANAIRNGTPVILCEDGFLRCSDTFANPNAPARYRESCAAVFDTRGYHFDASRETDIERMMNDPSLAVTPEQRAEARRLIDRIVSTRLTKYNHQPIFTPKVGRPGRRKVLVVDQSYGDQAIKRGWGSEQVFADMLEDAKRENPDADILVKTHPDTMTGTRSGYFVDVKEEGNVFRVTMPVNPYSLMELVDKVYVCSTQMGFEALMAGKEVHVYGMPFYAGWGLTVDKQTNPRRTNKRTLEEAFYIFYLLYTHWVDVETGRPCTIDKAMDNLIALREEYAQYGHARQPSQLASGK